MPSTVPANTVNEAHSSDLDWAANPDSAVNVELQRRIDDCHHLLRTTFGHSDYKGKQKEIIEAALAGRDVFVLAPTGMGKSLCFQIPAASDKHGLTLVISPLIALIKNQVDGLLQKRVLAASLTSETPPDEKNEVVEALRSGHPETRLLYTTPERLSLPEFIKLIRVVYKAGGLNRFVVDEAHCISEWGHDFREDYRRIGIFRKKFPDVPIMALTATASRNVADDIIRSLGMIDRDLFQAAHPFNRPNLYYEVRYAASSDELAKMAEICDYICGLHRKRGKVSCGIIYCRTRKTCDSVSGYLRSKGLAARPYHRGVPNTTLAKTLQEWSVPGGSDNGGVDVVVATIAFGLGIDKGDVRYIIHYDIPKSFEGYYQETGRAGRNGAPAKCILYYSREDLRQVQSWVRNSHTNRVQKAEDLQFPAPSQRSISSLEKLAIYAENTNVCRHISICRYFGEEIDENNPEILKQHCDKMCDVCKYPEKARRRKESLGPTPLEFPAAPSRPSRPSGMSTDPTTLSNQNGKRMGNYANGNPSAIKKPKTTDYAKTLITKPHDSTATLSKPFKPPSFKNSRTTSVVSLPAAKEIVAKKGEEQPLRNIENDSRRLPGPSFSTSATEIVQDLPDIRIELEDPSSAKVPAAIRLQAIHSLRQTIHHIWSEELWRSIEESPVDDHRRTKLIATLATEIEYDSMFCFCSTTEGYQRLYRSKVEGLNLLRDKQSWKQGVEEERYEDAHAAIEIMRRLCR